jgi:phosphoserine phosphatase
MHMVVQAAWPGSLQSGMIAALEPPPDAIASEPLDLVVQAPALPAEDVDMLLLLTGAAGVAAAARAGNDAVRLTHVRELDGVAEAADAAGYDVALVPNARTLERVRLVAMDMDSTLITIECIDEIAALQGLKAEVAAVTASAMRGEIDFAGSLRRRVALLAGLPVAALEQVYDERLRLTAGAERMLAGFRAVGAKSLLVSGGFTFFTERLRTRLGLDFAFANTLETHDGRLTGRVTEPVFDAAAKAAALRATAQAVGAAGGLVVAIGDGANDLPMLQAADVSVAFRAKPRVRAAATHAIDHCGLDAVLNLFA